MNLIYLLITGSMLFISCKSQGQDVKKAPKFKSVQKDSIIEYFTTCHYKNYELRVNTRYIKDYISEREDTLQPVIIEQYMEFYKDNKKIKIVPLPINAITKKKLLSGKSMKIFKVYIHSIKFIQHNNEAIFQIYGGSTVNYNDEFFGLTSLEGDWLWYYYGNMYEIYKQFGDQKSIEENYGSEVRTLKKMIRVYPPDKAGKIR